MDDGTNAAVLCPGKEMMLEEGMEILYNDLKDLSLYAYRMVEYYWEQLLPTVDFWGGAMLHLIHAPGGRGQHGLPFCLQGQDKALWG